MLSLTLLKIAIVVSKALQQNSEASIYLSPQGCNMKKFILHLWQAWNEARLAYANRFARHRLGS